MEISEKIGVLEGHEQVLITTIRKETKRTEELEEAGYRPPTWAVLRALQQINSTTRVKERRRSEWHASMGSITSVRFRLKPDNSNSHEFELHRPSNKGTKLLFKVIKSIIIIIEHCSRSIVPRELKERRRSEWHASISLYARQDYSTLSWRKIKQNIHRKKKIRKVAGFSIAAHHLCAWCNWRASCVTA